MFDYFTLSNQIVIVILILITTSMLTYIVLDALKIRKSIDTINSKKKIFIYLTSYAFISFSTLVLSDIWVFIKKDKEFLIKESQDRFLLKNQILLSNFSKSYDYLFSIRDSKDFRNYLRSSGANQTRVEDFFLTLASTDETIMQLRYLDKDGLEQVRVDRNISDDEVFIVPQNKHQNKSDRYYFTNSVNKSSIWFSSLDLNIENKEIEIPYRPTYRAILPIWENDIFSGILIVNYFASNFINSAIDDSFYDITLLDGKGFLIADSQNSLQWEKVDNAYPQNRFYSDFRTQKSIVQSYENYLIGKLSLPLNEDLLLVYEVKDIYLSEYLSKKLNSYLYTFAFIFVISSILISIIIKLFNVNLKKIFDYQKKLEDTNKNLKGEKEKTVDALEEARVAEEEALATQEQLEQLNQELSYAYNAKSEFLSNMSHEIRTPLAGIIGITDLVLENNNLSKEDKEYLTIVKNSSDKLKGIINDILDFSKIQSGKFQIIPNEFSLRDLLIDVESLFKPQVLNKNLEFKLDIDENIDDVLIGDELRINQVITNLVGNSLKFTKEGIVNLNVKSIKKFSNKITLKFAIIDTGIGMNSSVQKTIFEAFTQGELSNTKNFVGTGLGLSITKNLVELMGGEIWFESIENIGTKFFFTLDLEFVKGKKLQKQEDSVEMSLNKSKRVLVAEDSDINQIVISNLLSKIGFDITIVNDGREALEIAKKEKFDIIFMDIQMPNMDGYEATHKIRLFDNKTPIIALSAAILQEDIEKSLDAGMNDHIGKPIHKDELYKCINKYFNLKEEKKDKNKTQKMQVRGMNVQRFMQENDFDKESVNELLKYFISSYKTYPNLLKSKEISDEALMNYIHKLKGSCGNLQMDNLYVLCKDFELTKDDRFLDDIVEELNMILESIKNR